MKQEPKTFLKRVKLLLTILILLIQLFFIPSSYCNNKITSKVSNIVFNTNVFPDPVFP